MIAVRRASGPLVALFTFALWLGSLPGCGTSAPAGLESDSPPPAAASSVGPEVLHVGLTVADLDRSLRFFRDVLGFALVGEPQVEAPPPGPGAGAGARARSARLRLGREEMVLTSYDPPGRPIPADSASNDLWFQHLAIVVSDMEAAHGRLLAHGVRPISRGGPQTIPASNPAAAGVRAFYFRDPDDHPLEIIWYPADKGQPRWHAGSPLFLGVDHTAIAISDTARSRAFYEGLFGFHRAGGSLNHGPTQAALSGVAGARVEITALAGRAGPGIELLRYLEPGPGRPAPASTRQQDLWRWETTVAVDDLARSFAASRARGALWGTPFAAGFLVRDPDGHVLRIVGRGPPPISVRPQFEEGP